MKVIYKTHKDMMKDITLVCSPAEVITIMDGLRQIIESEITHEDDRRRAERMLSDMRD